MTDKVRLLIEAEKSCECSGLVMAMRERGTTLCPQSCGRLDQPCKANQLDESEPQRSGVVGRVVSGGASVPLGCQGASLHRVHLCHSMVYLLSGSSRDLSHRSVSKAAAPKPTAEVNTHVVKRTVGRQEHSFNVLAFLRAITQAAPEDQPQRERGSLHSGRMGWEELRRQLVCSLCMKLQRRRPSSLDTSLTEAQRCWRRGVQRMLQHSDPWLIRRSQEQGAGKAGDGLTLSSALMFHFREWRCCGRIFPRDEWWLTVNTTALIFSQPSCITRQPPLCDIRVPTVPVTVEPESRGCNSATTVASPNRSPEQWTFGQPFSRRARRQIFDSTAAWLAYIKHDAACFSSSLCLQRRIDTLHCRADVSAPNPTCQMAVRRGPVFGDYYHFRHRAVVKRSLSSHRGTHVRLDKEPKGADKKEEPPSFKRGRLETIHGMPHLNVFDLSWNPGPTSVTIRHGTILIHLRVLWVEQQVVKQRKKRDIYTDPTDPKFAQQWYLWLWWRCNLGRWQFNPSHRDLNAKEAWEQGYTGAGVVVSILDDGIEKNHPDLADNYDPKASYDVNDGDPDPQPRYTQLNDNRRSPNVPSCLVDVYSITTNRQDTVLHHTSMGASVSGFAVGVPSRQLSSLTGSPLGQGLQKLGPALHHTIPLLISATLACSPWTPGLVRGLDGGEHGNVLWAGSVPCRETSALIKKSTSLFTSIMLPFFPIFHTSQGSYEAKTPFNGDVYLALKASLDTEAHHPTHPSPPRYSTEHVLPAHISFAAAMGHGTRCAGEVAAVANNGICGVGVAYNAKIGGELKM
ncbi:hypothetical protein JZ751_020741 [Albula glossodonta]|uniref:Peptidase S8/S53 domain-containing protein n=1 Tax=Albula glossodonta TaxID=121402 RepID=A0A8T2PNF4_9TELE|nr:hypothetical protein JZ751_020741 [Albula glossodonta]